MDGQTVTRQDNPFTLLLPLRNIHSKIRYLTFFLRYCINSHLCSTFYDWNYSFTQSILCSEIHKGCIAQKNDLINKTRFHKHLHSQTWSAYDKDYLYTYHSLQTWINKTSLSSKHLHSTITHNITETKSNIDTHTIDNTILRHVNDFHIII